MTVQVLQALLGCSLCGTEDYEASDILNRSIVWLQPLEALTSNVNIVSYRNRIPGWASSKAER